LDNTPPFDVLDLVSLGTVPRLWDVQDLVDHVWLWVGHTYPRSLVHTRMGTECNIIHSLDFLSADVQMRAFQSFRSRKKGAIMSQRSILRRSQPGQNVVLNTYISVQLISVDMLLAM
jgi:hypothetical protein